MIRNKLNTFLSVTDYRRLTLIESNTRITKIIVDVHGMKCFEVRRFINNIISIVNSDFKLDIIHGYNHGTAIKDMLANNYNNSHISGRHQDSYNQGITHMSIAA